MDRLKIGKRADDYHAKKAILNKVENFHEEKECCFMPSIVYGMIFAFGIVYPIATMYANEDANQQAQHYLQEHSSYEEIQNEDSVNFRMRVHDYQDGKLIAIKTNAYPDRISYFKIKPDLSYATTAENEEIFKDAF